MKTKLTKDEKEILDSFEKGECRRFPARANESLNRLDGPGVDERQIQANVFVVKAMLGRIQGHEQAFMAKLAFGPTRLAGMRAKFSTAK